MAEVSFRLKLKARAAAFLRYVLNVLISFDQFVGSFIPGSFPDETISARCYREDWKVAQFLVNTLFFSRTHCKDAYDAERAREHSPKSEGAAK